MSLFCASSQQLISSKLSQKKTHEIPRWVHCRSYEKKHIFTKKITQEKKMKWSTLIDNVYKAIYRGQCHPPNYKTWFRFSWCLLFVIPITHWGVHLLWLFFGDATIPLSNAYSISRWRCY
jgi:hypothetical protein